MKPTLPPATPVIVPLVEARDIALRIRELLLGKKAQDVVVLDARTVSPVTDYVVIASGAVAPQVRAMASEVTRALKAARVHPYRHSGTPEDGWVVLDYVDVVVHLFRDEIRRYYAIEELWVDMPRVD